MRATALAHPNIALIKYWGKRDTQENLPAVGSLSVTLDGLHSRTTVEFDAARSADTVLINGTQDPETSRRVSACLDRLRALAGIRSGARVESSNDFPTGAGLASSASGFAALVTAGGAALGLVAPAGALADIARLGSGSAPRSLYGGFVLMDNTAQGSVRCEPVLSAEGWPLRVVIAITSAARKEVGSRDGMAASRDSSPFYGEWVRSHGDDLSAAHACVRQRDFGRLADLAEHNCLKMHAVMQTTRPPLMYWEPATLACIRAIRGLRAAGVPVFFTVDAGPQVKAICEPAAAAAVADALSRVSGVSRVINSGLGAGARVVDD